MEFTKERGCSVIEQKPIWKNRKSSGTFEFKKESIGLEVLVMHEDLPTGLRAREALNDLELQSEIEIRFLRSLCRFGLLEDAELAETALKEARRADIVFLSMHGDREVPPVVRDWLLCWLETRDFKPCALVVSLDASARDSLKANSTLDFLRVITAPLEVDLFIHLGVSPFTTKDRGMLVNRHISVSKF